MAIRFYSDILSDDTNRAIWHESNGDIFRYMKETYNANRELWDEKRQCNVYIFPSKEKYMEFCLRWL